MKNYLLYKFILYNFYEKIRTTRPPSTISFNTCFFCNYNTTRHPTIYIFKLKTNSKLQIGLSNQKNDQLVISNNKSFHEEPENNKHIYQ